MAVGWRVAVGGTAVAVGGTDVMVRATGDAVDVGAGRVSAVGTGVDVVAAGVPQAAISRVTPSRQIRILHMFDLLALFPYGIAHAP